MSLFSRRNAALLGIDISTAAVKLLELSKQGTRYRVESYGVVPIEQEGVIDKNVANIDAVADAIKKVVRQSGSRLKNACVAVAGSAVMTKKITMPASLSEEEMEEQILVEADQYIPYSLDEVNLDFEVQGINKENKDMVDVLLAASRKESVENRIDVLQMAGLKAKIVDVEAFAVENALTLLADQIADGDDDQTVAVVDIGASMMMLNVIYGGKTIYTREQAFGGKQLTEEIQRRYGLSYEEAGLAKKHGGLPDNYLTDVLEPFKQAIVQQIARALQFFVSSSANRGVDHIVLSGGSSSISGLDKLVSQNIGIPAAIANPFMSMALSNKVKLQSLSNDAPAMMIACGLALRSFD